MANSIQFPANKTTRFHFIVSESNGFRSREEVTIVSGAGKLPGGTIMGKITATGKWTPYAPAATDGSQNAAGILGEDVDATSADVKRAMFVRDIEAQRAMLSFVGSPTTNQQNAAYTSLAAAGIVMR